MGLGGLGTRLASGYVLVHMKCMHVHMYVMCSLVPRPHPLTKKKRSGEPSQTLGLLPEYGEIIT